MNYVLIYLGGMAAIAIVACSLIVATFHYYAELELAELENEEVDVWRRVVES